MLGWLLTALAIAVNLHALLVLDLACGAEPTAAPMGTALRVRFVVLYGAVVVLLVQRATSPGRRRPRGARRQSRELRRVTQDNVADFRVRCDDDQREAPRQA